MKTLFWIFSARSGFVKLQSQLSIAEISSALFVATTGDAFAKKYFGNGYFVEFNRKTMNVSFDK